MRSLRLFVPVLALVACGGSDPSTSDSGAPPGDGGNPDSAVGACTSATVPTVLASNVQGAFSLSIVGNDVYWIDSSLGAGSILKTGLVQHVRTDGTGASTVVTPTAVLHGATAIGDDLFYFQEDDPQGSAIHMYRAPRSGGTGVMLGTATYPNFGVALISASLSFGVFAKRAADVLVSDGHEISRVSTADGNKTVIASGEIMWPRLVGATVFYTDLSGKLFSVSPDAVSPSATQLGTATCGTLQDHWMSAYGGGFMCGEMFGLDKVDATGTNKSHVVYTLKESNPYSLNPSPIDGTTFYGFPAGKGVPVFKMDVSGAATPVVCDMALTREVAMSATDLVWLEERHGAGSTIIHTLERIAR